MIGVGSCSFLHFSEKGAVSFKLDDEMAQKISAAAYEENLAENSAATDSSRSAGKPAIARDAVSSDIYMDIFLKGDVEAAATISVQSGAEVTFDDIDIGKRIYVVVLAYKMKKDSDSSQIKFELYSGESDVVEIKSGENQINLTLHRIQSSGGSSSSSTETFVVTYVTGEEHSSSNIPQQISYRSGAKVLTNFDTSDVMGFAIEGWYTDAECTEPFDSTAGISENLTLYAKWVESGITVIIDENRTDINIEKTINGYAITLTAPEAAEGESPYIYKWLIDGFDTTPDGVKLETGNSITIDMSSSNYIAGVFYDVTLILTKGSGSSAEEYSAFIQIKK